ncbi:putative RAD50-DNA repair protein [Serendipita vermifera]|nr:putative RAD50-DNA repair protein [Serendipita vermifera]
MAAEKEVKAQVKLRFRAANGTPMLVTRNLSVTQKKTAGMTMKTLEAVLAALPPDGVHDGKRHTISTKCAEMDIEIPNLLGVSKAVLDNVIFCHQEDSYWPLAEASVLKKKFDEIFEASKYTKALDAIKALRKERVSELKIDQERLQGNLREKFHGDKLKARIADLTATVNRKGAEYDELKTTAEALAVQNKEFYEKATKFRDTFLKFEAAEKRKTQLEHDLSFISDSLEVLDGTDAELEDRRRNFERHIAGQKSIKERKAMDISDEEERLVDVRRQLGEEQTREGQLTGEENAYHRNLARRNALVHEIARKNGLRGFEQDPLDASQWADFRTRMTGIQRNYERSLETVQADGQAKNSDFNAQLQAVQAETTSLKVEKDSLQKQIAERQRATAAAEVKLDGIRNKASELKGLQNEAEQKRKRIDTLKEEMISHNFDQKLEDKSTAMRELESQRDKLNQELVSSTQQMESRTTLGLRKQEVEKFDLDIQTSLETMSTRYESLLGHKPGVDKIESEIDRALLNKEKESKDEEADLGAANREVAQIEGSLSNLKSRHKQMEEEAKTLEKKLKSLLDTHGSVQEAIADTQEQLNLCQEEILKNQDFAKFYQGILETGRNKKICSSCNRHLMDNEMVAFEKHVSSLLKKDTSSKLKELEEELAVWQADLSRLQQGLPLEASYSKIKKVDIPNLLQEQKKLEEKLESASARAAFVSDSSNESKLAIKALQSLKQQADSIASLTQRRETSLQFVRSLEAALSSGRPIKSLEEIQGQLSTLQTKQNSIEREKQQLNNERDHLTRTLHTFESQLHQTQLRENQLLNDMRESERLEHQIKEDQLAIETARSRIKEIDTKVIQLKDPEESIRAEQRAYNAQLAGRVSKAQDDLQEVKLSINNLDTVAHSVDEYIRDQGDRKLKRCRGTIIDLKDAITRSLEDIERMRADVDKLGQEVSSANSTLATLTNNLLMRKLKRDITETEKEMGTLDLEQASRAHQQFEEKYTKAKAKEEEITRQSQHLQGELTTLRAQLKGYEADGREYKDAAKNYTDQLVKTKMSEMINSDLETYAKALDSAIMKYHSIKMAEVNDTMRYLWNRTYQGTDIDGIKIISEGEGATGKRNYNYRVVMVKDQVEMDMRGRCSAGQKMLASIIIRLALSDSFGANCGILALDEPTNALDIDNIEALAQSLVDIIRERRAQANFQLIIITHDENFLRKLGEAAVIDHYWRVSRDGRQKSTVEKQAISL